MASRTIIDVYEFMRYIVRKERGAFLTITEAMDALDVAQLDVFNDYHRAYGVNQDVQDALAPFKETGWFSSSSTGSVALPSDYLHLLTIYTVAGSTINKVRFVNEDELTNALDSQLRPVSTAKPIARMEGNSVQLYPQSTQLGTFIYFRRPVKPVLAVTESGRTITYNAASSTQLEWGDEDINGIIAKALVYIGVNMDDQALTQFAAEYSNESKQ
jgi:hypothetical protein